MVDLDGRFIIVRHVPCHKCSQCGEVSYNGEAVARLEEIVAKLGVESEIFLHINILIWIMNQRGIRYSMIYLN
ncbi:MAG: YgiT-type zinc finger protein [Lachnospiraceae bacterium]|nr:YgiT-type zinc finger protein [Lachnospiraceae bacterium]